jgi:type IV pilus assembly protein PilB
MNERKKTRPDCNSTMVEDPIEYRMQGVTQLQVNNGVGFTFPHIVRTLLRMDPDVIGVGDTREGETAQLALEASAGHLVITAVHAKDVVGTLHRLEALGCERSLISQAVSLVLVQKLLPKLCGSCVRLEVPTPMMAEALTMRRLIDKGSNVPLPRAVGCEACSFTGFLGRVAAFESLMVNEEIRDAFVLGQPYLDIQRLALAGKQFNPFRWYAAYLMSRRMISAADAIAAVSD